MASTPRPRGGGTARKATRATARQPARRRAPATPPVATPEAERQPAGQTAHPGVNAANAPRTAAPPRASRTFARHKTLSGAAIAGVAIAAASGAIGSWSANSQPAPSTPITTTTNGGPVPPVSGVQPTVLFLPDPTLHPGAINRAVTATQLCATGYTTKTVRPPVSYTGKLKQLEFGDGGQITAPSGTVYTVVGEHLPGAVGDYELDHLISLEIGGNPEDPRNLWMQPWERRGTMLAPPGKGAETKDVLENRLHQEVCAGTISLTDAQTEIAGNWFAAH